MSPRAGLQRRRELAFAVYCKMRYFTTEFGSENGLRAGFIGIVVAAIRCSAHPAPNEGPAGVVVNAAHPRREE